KANFTNGTDYVPVAQLTQVFSGDVTIAANGSWTEITLNTPFMWDGTSNLLVAVDENSPGYGASGDAWSSYNAGTNRGLMYYMDDDNIDPINPLTNNPSTFGPSSTIAQIQIVASAPLACSI